MQVFPGSAQGSHMTKVEQAAKKMAVTNKYFLDMKHDILSKITELFNILVTSWLILTTVFDTNLTPTNKK